MMKKTVLCYGDSNTWGTIPRWFDSDLPSERYDENTRWTRILQKELGDEYEVIEEGLGGRTTIFSPAAAPWKNGKDYLVPCLMSHRQLDLVVIMLGTNDLHQGFRMEEKDLGNGIRELIELTQAQAKAGRGFEAPKILIIAPVEVWEPDPKGRVKVYDGFYREWGTYLSKQYPKVYREIADEYGCYFLNAAEYAHPGLGDGIHLTAESHVSLGKAVAEKISAIFGTN